MAQRGNPEWTKGMTSPNPGGKTKTVREALEAFRKPEDLEMLRLRLLEIAADGSDKDSTGAIREYHDRAYGKPAQAVTGPDGEDLFRGGARELADALVRKLAKK